MKKAAIEALEAKHQRIPSERPLAERLAAIAEELAALAAPGGREMTKDEVDAMWGFPIEEAADEPHCNENDKGRLKQEDD